MLEHNHANVIIRQARLDDAELLYTWRNDPIVRESSRNTEFFDFTAHISWLKNTLTDKNRGLYIAEDNNVPVGTIRYDLLNGWYELSWTVDPKQQRKGYGKKMVELMIALLPGPFFAEIKNNNLASIRMAESLGMIMEFANLDILHYTKGKSNER